MGTIEFHHIGLLTEEPHAGEIAYPSMKLGATSPDADPNRAECRGVCDEQKNPLRDDHDLVVIGPVGGGEMKVVALIDPPQVAGMTHIVIM